MAILKKVKKILSKDSVSKVLSVAKKKTVKKIVKKVAKKTVKKTTQKVVRKTPVKKIVKKEKTITLKRHSENPILSPTGYSWESKATFNPTAFLDGDTIHIIYRATGDDDSSVLGYAYTYDGTTIEGRPTYHIYKRFFGYNENVPKIDYLSGGGWSGGCEDPRIVLIDGILYMTFTAFDGWGSVRVALTSIPLEDFKNNKWNWKKTTLISPPGEIHKNWVLFPEKIHGKFAIMHSFYPKILIEYFDDLSELDGETKFIKSNNSRPVDYSRGWDSWFRGVGPSPIKTKDGWLVLYHAMDHVNPDRYRLGALLLDLDDPTKILYRSKNPILEPEEDYENNGHKWGVIYACGAVIKDGELLVYYGGADKYVCVAKMDLETLIDSLKQSKDIQLVSKKK